MRESESLLVFVLAVVTGFVLFTGVFVAASAASANEVNSSAGGFTCQGPDLQSCQAAVAAHVEYQKDNQDDRAELDQNDQHAALRSIQFALSNVGDGTSYVWKRGNGRISSVVRPTGSFKDGGGRVCRHVVIKFISGPNSRSIETIACRRLSGVWEISG